MSVPSYLQRWDSALWTLWSEPASHSQTPGLTGSQSARSSQENAPTWPAPFSQESQGKLLEEQVPPRWLSYSHSQPSTDMKGGGCWQCSLCQADTQLPQLPQSSSHQAAGLPSHLQLLQGKREHLEGFARGRTGRSIQCVWERRDTLTRAV